VIKHKIFIEEESMEVIFVCDTHNTSMMVQRLLECYNVTHEDHDDEYPYNIQVPETEGEQSVEGPKIESTTYVQPVKT